MVTSTDALAWLLTKSLWKGETEYWGFDSLCKEKKKRKYEYSIDILDNKIPVFIARFMSVLLAARISSFLSVNSSANRQMISALFKCSQDEQVTQLSTRGQCCTLSGWPTVLSSLLGLGAKMQESVHSYAPLLSAAPQLGLVD